MTDVSAGPRGRRFLHELLVGDAGIGFPRGEASFGWGEADAASWDPVRYADAVQTALDEIEPDPLKVSAALADAVAWAMYWQEPDPIDDALADPQIRAAFRTVDVDKFLALLGPGDKPGFVTVLWTGRQERRPAADVLAEWRESTLRAVARAERERPDDPTASWSGAWWSQPPSELVSSMGVTPSGVPEALEYVEDGPPTSDTAIGKVTTDAGRLYVIDDAADWAALCDQHPLDVTAETRHDWYRATGRDGRWIIPDWAEAARAWDSVLLTKRGYLALAGTVIPVERGASTIAGWNPGETYWLTDVTVTDETPWHQNSDQEWVPGPDSSGTEGLSDPAL